MMRTAVSMGMMLAEAQMVVGLRALGAVGLWNLGPGEGARMWAEKSQAARQSGAALTSALLGGAAPAAAMAAALAPVRAKTRANAKRLVKRGPI